MSRRITLKGQRFGRLIARYHIPKEGWFCECDCGGSFTARSTALLTKNNRSCGCLTEEYKNRRAVHHAVAQSEYRIWSHIKQRCYNPKSDSYHLYGARGIRVCEKWLNSFEAFLADVGSRPSPKHTIDRIDCNGNYEPANCRWATAKQQTRNRRVTVCTDIGGVIKPLAEWAEVLGIDYTVVNSRVQRGWSHIDALTTPAMAA